jgi:response regulator RpfG family c-di-GMP phosphodiesterase
VARQKVKILFVDDEPAALASFELTQRDLYDVRIAESGAKGLEVLEQEPDIAIVISDMRMPGMDGAQFLAQVRVEAPDAVRLLLTGHTDMEAAARAVNEGRIFRFLIKPCAPPDLRVALAAAVKMHELVTAERTLLQKTLVGSVKAVVNVLGLTNPEALGRAMRIKNKARLAAQKLKAEDRWGVEFAALFSQIAAATLPQDTVQKLYRGATLSTAETEQLIAATDAIKGLLADIPRLEPVTTILSELTELVRQPSKVEQVEARAEQPARLLHAIIDLEALESAGQSLRQAVATMRQREAVYGAATLDALVQLVDDAPGVDVAATRPLDLEVGMVLAEDLRTTDGLLLLPRGFELTKSSCVHIVERFRHCLPDRVRVHLSPELHTAAPAPRQAKDQSA